MLRRIPSGTGYIYMNILLQPWHLLVLILANWLNRQQQTAVDYLLTENQMLKQIHGKRRIACTVDQRRRLPRVIKYSVE